MLPSVTAATGASLASLVREMAAIAWKARPRWHSVRMAFDVSAFTTADAEYPPTPVTIDWEAVEGWLGLRLPDDYKELASRYRPLYFGDWIWIHVPCAEDGRFDYGGWLRSTHREARGKL